MIEMLSSQPRFTTKSTTSTTIPSVADFVKIRKIGHGPVPLSTLASGVVL